MGKIQIQSHLPGIFYRKPDPDLPTYKNDGDSVVESDIIGLIEVMKSFHEIPAGVSGNSIKFLIDNGAPIMPGQVIAELDGGEE
jgi:biotin carboxyl carrier protein|tara:strand:+ start:166 stop:417 length:252 start_codon:yes stop_codon:yes gene_type:complete